MANKIMSGARAIVKINDQLVAFSTNVNYRVSQPHQPVIVLGRYSPARHEPVGYDVSVSMSAFRFTAPGGKGNSPDSKQLISKFQPTLNELISSEELKIEVFDRATDETVVVMHRCKMIDRSGNLSARDLLSETWSFVGVKAENSDSGAQEESSGAGSIPPNTAAAQ